MDASCLDSNFDFAPNSNVAFTCASVSLEGCKDVAISLNGSSCIDLNCTGNKVCQGLTVTNTSTESWSEHLGGGKGHVLLSREPYIQTSRMFGYPYAHVRQHFTSTDLLPWRWRLRRLLSRSDQFYKFYQFNEFNKFCGRLEFHQFNEFNEFRKWLGPILHDCINALYRFNNCRDGNLQLINHRSDNHKETLQPI
eukprot:s818_g21.t1